MDIAKLEEAELAVELAIAELSGRTGTKFAMELTALANLAGTEPTVELAYAELAEPSGAKLARQRKQIIGGSDAERNSDVHVGLVAGRGLRLHRGPPPP